MQLVDPSKRVRNFLDSTYSLDKLFKFLGPCLLLSERLTSLSIFDRARNILSIGRGIISPSLIYCFWRVALIGDPRTVLDGANKRIESAKDAIGPSGRVLCFLLGLIALGRLTLFLNNKWIRQIELGPYRAKLC